MMRDTPPFRADHVGSILRTAPLKDARAKAGGEIDAAELKAVEDVEIRKIIAKQEAIGLKAITDGEYRRSWWHYDFLGELDGVNLEGDQGIQFKGVHDQEPGADVTRQDRLRRSHPLLEHFKFLKANTKQTPKMTIPSPSMLYYRGGRKRSTRASIPTRTTYWHDLGHAYREAPEGFYDAGCRYLQIDDCSFAYFCDPSSSRCCPTAATIPKSCRAGLADMINAALRRQARRT